MSDHVGPIVFANETARSQLVDYGEVVTFRSDDRTVGETWWTEKHPMKGGTKEGDVEVERIGQRDPSKAEDLAPYVDLSGFESVWDWQAAIEDLHGGLSPGCLYRVRTLPTTSPTR